MAPQSVPTSTRPPLQCRPSAHNLTTKPTGEKKDSLIKNSTRSGSQYKGDRFIPFRGTDNDLGEFLINNDINHEQKKKPKKQNNENTNTLQVPNNSNSQDTS